MFSQGAVLGDGLGALANGVLGELTWEEELNGSLDLSGREGVLAVVAHKTGGLVSNLFEHVVDERVHDAHGSLGDAGVLVDLLENSVDVDREGLSAAAASVVLLGGGGLDSLALGSWFSCGFCHFDLVGRTYYLLRPPA